MSRRIYHIPNKFNDLLGFNIDKQISNTQAALIKEHPFFASLLSNRQIIVVPFVAREVQTAGTDGSRIFWNPAFMDAIGPENRKFVVCHELYHIIFDSMGRRNNRDMGLWNSATDFKINEYLVKSGFTMPTNAELLEGLARIQEEIQKNSLGTEFEDIFKKPEDGGKGKEVDVAPEKIMGLLDSKYDEMSAEQIYEELLKEQKDDPQSQQGQGDGQGNGDLLDENALGQLDTHLIDQLSQEEKDELKQNVTEEMIRARNSAKDRGDIPAGVEEIIDELKDTRISWRNLLQADSSSVMTDDYTFRRVNKRHFSRGITLPGIEVQKVLRAAMIVDTSGSMSNEELQDVLTEMVSIANQFQNYELTVICFDTQLYNEKVFTTEEQDIESIGEYRFKGRGGTVIKPAMDWLLDKKASGNSEDEFDWVVTFTDGFIEDWHEYMEAEYPNFVWLINANSWSGTTPKPTWGTVINYDKYE